MGKLLKINRLISLDSSYDGSNSDTSYEDPFSQISLYFQYFILNIAVLFIYPDVIYKNAIFSPYLFLYYPFAQIGINTDTE